MERKIGETFNIGKEEFQCVERLNLDCVGCSFRVINCWELIDDLGECNELRRTDGKNVIFKWL